MDLKKMKAVTVNGYGSPNVLQLQEVELPQPGPGEVLVKVNTSAATTADTLMRAGKPYFARLFLGIKKPKHPIPGTGFAGTIARVGSAVTKFKTGDRVFGETTLGFSANAEFLTLPETGVILPMPSKMTFREAASYGDGHLTSYNFLVELAGIKSGQRVLINGASGALGTAAVQIAKFKGCHVTAVCSSKNRAMVKSLGADEVIDYHLKDFTKSSDPYDIVYDAVGKSSFKAAKNVLSEDGVYLSPVLKGSLLFAMIKTSISKGKRAIFEATGTKKDDNLRELMKKVLVIYNEGHLKTIIDREYPLEKLAEAHRYIETGHKTGNVVIVHS